MTKLVLDDISTGYGSTTKLNSNFTAIEEALDNTLSRDGTSPNGMLADLDMNSRKILNLPAATSNTEPVTYAQFLAAQGDLLYSGEIDASAVVFTPTGTGAEERNISQELVLLAHTPEQFGAVGDGVTDDTTAVQACINACIASGVAQMYAPNVYKITSTLQITVADPGAFTITGAAPYKSRFVYSGTGYCIQVGTGQANIADGWFVTIQNLGFYAANSTPTGAIKMNGTRFCKIRNCMIRDFSNASGISILFAGAGDIINYFCIVEGCYIRNSPTGIRLDGGTGIGANSNWIRNNWFGVHTRSIDVDGADTNIIEANEFNGSTTTAIYIQNAAAYTKILYNQFDGPTTGVNIASGDETFMIANTGSGFVVIDSGTNTFNIDPFNGRFYDKGGLIVGGSNAPTNVIPLRISLPAGHATNSFSVTSSAGTTLFSVNQSGAVTGVTLNTTGSISQTNTNGNSVLHSIDNTGTAATVLAKWKQASAQTANVLEVRNTSDVIEFRIAPKGFLEFLEQTDPAAPASNRAVLYSRDNGSGKTQLCVRFPTGAVQVLATEP